MNIDDHDLAWLIPVLIVIVLSWMVFKGIKNHFYARPNGMKKIGALLGLQKATKTEKKEFLRKFYFHRDFRGDRINCPGTILLGNVNGVKVTLADNYVMDDNDWWIRKNTLLVIQSNSLNLTPFALCRSGWFEKLASRGLHFDTHPEFSKKFYLNNRSGGVDADQELRELFSNELIDLCLANPDITLVGKGDEFIFRNSYKHFVNLDDLSSFVELGIKILSLLSKK